MNATACRDCGHLLDMRARGCPQCARNLEAETMIARFIRWRLMPVTIILAALLALFIWLR
jgi:hypothetical protein